MWRNRIIKAKGVPQILMGASSSSKLGWLMKMSLEATQSCLISDSESWTCFPGRANRTSVRRRIMSSRTASSITCPCVLIASDQNLLLILLLCSFSATKNKHKGEPTKSFIWFGSLSLSLSVCVCLLSTVPFLSPSYIYLLFI